MKTSRMFRLRRLLDSTIMNPGPKLNPAGLPSMLQNPYGDGSRMARLPFILSILPLYLMAWLINVGYASLGLFLASFSGDRHPYDTIAGISVLSAAVQIPLGFGVAVMLVMRLHDIGRGGWLAWCLGVLVLFPLLSFPFMEIACLLIPRFRAGLDMTGINASKYILSEYGSFIPLPIPRGLNPLSFLAIAVASLLIIAWLALMPGTPRHTTGAPAPACA